MQVRELNKKIKDFLLVFKKRIICLKVRIAYYLE